MYYTQMDLYLGTISDIIQSIQDLSGLLGTGFSREVLSKKLRACSDEPARGELLRSNLRRLHDLEKDLRRVCLVRAPREEARK